MGKKSQTQLSFDADRSIWYKQDVFYIDSKGDKSLYNELKDFGQSVNKEMDFDLFFDCFNDLTRETERPDDEKILKPKRESQGNARSHGITGRPEKSSSGGFFDGKLELLKNEIADCNRNLEKREKIEAQSSSFIDSEIKEVKSRLQEIYTWKIPNQQQQAIEFIRMEFLKQLAALYREKRQCGLSSWKDIVFEKKDRRNLLFEYKSLNWTGEMTSQKSRGERQ